MAAKKRTKGECVFCNKEFTKSGMRKHLSSCRQRQKMIKEKEVGNSKEIPLYHLEVSTPFGSVFFLNLEVNAYSELHELNHYLRAIWLECCGHLSQFSYSGSFGEELPMESKIHEVVEPDIKISHIYDFGTSTETHIELVEDRYGTPLTTQPICLMARNNLPELVCELCDNPASRIGEGPLCTDHIDSDPEFEAEELLPIVNSPRTGVCGYDGPAEPPY